jgi:hypothetical protein
MNAAFTSGTEAFGFSFSKVQLFTVKKEHSDELP